MLYDRCMPSSDPTRARRVAKRATLALLLGLLLNLFVAWGLSLIPHAWGPGNSRAVQLLWNAPDGSRKTAYTLVHKWFGVREHQYHTTRRGRLHDRPDQISVWWAWQPWDHTPNAIDESKALFDEFNPVNPDATIVSRTRYGFPALTLQCESMIDDTAPLPNGSFLTKAHGVFFDRIDSNNFMGKPEVWPHARHLWFPYLPIWSGLIINTLFYALIALIVLYLISRVRNARRMLRGRCPFCAYELHHDFTHGCSECGWRAGDQ